MTRTLERARPVPGLPVPAPPTASLGVVAELFRRLDAEAIRYCHWKSNEHLAAAVAGATDLDVLVDRRAAPALARILAVTGFKRFVAAPELAYVGVEDYLAVDAVSGGLAHLHLHYRLVLGEKHLKGYRLPWEELVLATRRPAEDHPVSVIDPNLELLLLLVRSALKLRARDRLRRGSGDVALDDGALREYRWLVARIGRERWPELARTLIGDEAAGLVAGMLDRPPTAGRLRALRRRLAPILRPHRTYGSIEALWRAWHREWRTRAGRAGRRLLRMAPHPRKHTLPQGGVVIALVGSDGSGKSSLAAELTRWLSWKAEVVPLYFGFGDGPVSLSRRPLRWLKTAARRRGPAAARPAPAARGGGTGPPRGPMRRFGKGLFDLLWAWAVLRERRGRLVRARRARDRGAIVVCDRFPQSRIAMLSDGPLLAGWLEHRSPLLHAAAAREQAVYRAMELGPPDLVVKLHVSAQVAAQRKPQLVGALLPHRLDAVRALRFPAATRVVEIDADRPWNEVLLQVKRAVWEAI